MNYVRQRWTVTERRASRVIGQLRSTQPYVERKPEKDQTLVERMVELARKNPRYGYYKVWVLLRREGFEINKKRVDRL